MAIDPKALKVGDKFRFCDWPQGSFCRVIFIGEILIGTIDDNRDHYDWSISNKMFWKDCELIQSDTSFISHKEELAKIAERLIEIANQLRELP